MRQAFQAGRARAYFWEYRYLNYFLVPHTRVVLDWLAGLKDMATVELFDNLWLPAIPNPDERKAVMRALLAHNLVELDVPWISVTPQGREYLALRGPLPNTVTKAASSS